MNKIEKQFIADMYYVACNGLYAKAKDYIIRHPEYWSKTSDGKNKICSMSINISTIVKDDKDIHNAEPWISINIGDFRSRYVRLSDISKKPIVDVYTSHSDREEEVLL